MKNQKDQQDKKYQITKLAGGIDLMVYDVCVNGVYMTMNESCKNVVGYEAQEMIGHTAWEFLVPETIKNHKKSYIKHIKEKIPYVKVRHFFIHKNGSTIRLESSGIPIMEGNKCIGYKIISKDVTKEEQMEQELKIREHELLQKNQELEHFTFSVSHDLKAPLVTLEGFSSAIQEDIGVINDSCPFHADEKCKKKEILKNLYDSAEEIKKATQELSLNIESLLELSRVGRLHTNRSKIDPKRIIKYVLKMNEQQVEQSNAVISIQSFRNPRINVQKEVFTSIIQNVIGNALQHAKKKDQKELQINISIKKENRTNILISISDNGKGIRKKELENMFTTMSERGKGFGLAIIRKGIEWHNGKIWAESNGTQGTKINMFFPNCI